MSVTVTNEKSVEFWEWNGKSINKPCLVSDISENKLEYMSVAFTTFKKGTVVNWRFPFEELIYIIKGTQSFECEGKTYIAKKGDTVIISRGTKLKQTAETDSEQICVMVMTPKVDLKATQNC